MVLCCTALICREHSWKDDSRKLGNRNNVFFSVCYDCAWSVASIESCQVLTKRCTHRASMPFSSAAGSITCVPHTEGSMSSAMNVNDTLACTYACLMLNDAGMPLTAENIETACNAAGATVRNTLPILFARFLEKKPIESLISAAMATAPQGGAAAAGGAATAAAAAGGSSAAPAAAKKEEKEEEEDDDMGFGLFD